MKMLSRPQTQRSPRPSPFACRRGCSGLAGLLLLAAGTGGCTYKNQPLNALNVQLEARARNHTRADTQLELAPARPEGERDVVLQPAPPTSQAAPRPSPRPPSGPTGAGPGAPPPDADGYFVGLAISGGGSRASNFSAACMFQLQKIGMLRHVDYISSVSGGSLTAAYYCLSDDAAWNPGDVQRKLSHAFASDLIRDYFMPWNGFALAFTDYDRSDLLAKSLTRVLFNRHGRPLTFADLRPDRPHLLMNAADLQSGRRFVFCNETFDELNSDLSKYPVSYAVAASAAVPVLLHQVTLRDFSTVWPQYRHFIDGGIVDNLGVQTLVEVYEGRNQAAVERGLPAPYPNGAIFIVIDAKTRFTIRLQDKGDIGLIESLKTGADLTSTALVSRASSATLADMIVRYAADDVTAVKLRGQMEQLEKTGYLETFDRRKQKVRIVHVSLTQINDLGQRAKLPFNTFSESLDSISTFFNINPSDAYNLYQAADLLMKERFGPILKPMVEELKTGASDGVSGR